MAIEGRFSKLYERRLIWHQPLKARTGSITEGNFVRYLDGHLNTVWLNMLEANWPLWWADLPKCFDQILRNTRSHLGSRCKILLQRTPSGEVTQLQLPKWNHPLDQRSNELPQGVTQVIFAYFEWCIMFYSIAISPDEPCHAQVSLIIIDHPTFSQKTFRW